jgi:hypothetical protein
MVRFHRRSVKRKPRCDEKRRDFDRMKSERCSETATPPADVTTLFEDQGVFVP